MKKIIFFLLFLPLLSWAQITENFSDGDFTQNPAWNGNDTYYTIDNYQLKLNSVSGIDSSYLSTASSVINNTEWNFLVRLAFTPSSSNHPRIYLVSDSDNLRGPLNGYFIRIGKDGTDNKRIYFCKQTGTVITEILTGSDNIASGTNNLLRIKIVRDAIGTWEFYCDNLGGNSYIPQGSVFDNTHTTTSWFGVMCKYTTSNINKFYFDDFYAGPILIDTMPPFIENINVIDNNHLEILFNEAVEILSVENTMNYFVNLGIGTPISAQRDAANLKKVTLNFSNSFVQGTNYHLTVYNIEDLVTNLLDSQTVNFVFFTPSLHDIVFNELMVDPNPVVGLPDFEYIELYNTTNVPINIQGWKIKFGTTEKTLPYALIPADSFVVLTTTSGFSALSGYGNVVSVDGLTLTNTGNMLILSDNNGNLIHAINYADTWYQDNNKKDGGWSLEQIDPHNPCSGISNWKASTDISGGTPCRTNSVNGDNSDLMRPDLIRVGIIDSVTIEVFFSENMMGSTLTNLTSYTIDNGIGQPLMIIQQYPLYGSVILKLATPIQALTKYKLTIDNLLTDCSNNPVSERNFAYFGIPQNALPNDVVINELLSNPPTDGVDYVEIYNRSTKIIDLKNLRLTSKDTILNVLTSIKVISDGSYLIFPGDYIALTTNSINVLSNYNTPNPHNFVNMASMPAFNNADGIVVLADVANTVIDLFIYNENMHYPLLASFKGVSFERIHYDRPSNDVTNWHSAAESVGFGTPAYKNSQFGIAVTEDNPISLSPDIFSPDNDGKNDVLNISYQFNQPGFTANIMIYDSKGRQVKYLIKNELLGTEGIFSWDGIADDNLKATIGIYIVFFEVFDLDGKVKSYKKTTVLGGRLN